MGETTLQFGWEFKTVRTGWSWTVSLFGPAALWVRGQRRHALACLVALGALLLGSALMYPVVAPAFDWPAIDEVSDAWWALCLVPVWLVAGWRANAWRVNALLDAGWARVEGAPPSDLPHPELPTTAPSAESLAHASRLNRLAWRMRVSALAWFVLGGLLCLSVIGLVAGVVNLLAGRARWRCARQIQDGDDSVLMTMPSPLSLVVLGAANLLLGGAVGLVLVALDVWVRRRLLADAQLLLDRPARGGGLFTVVPVNRLTGPIGIQATDASGASQLADVSPAPVRSPLGAAARNRLH